jgi:hypothetical protein
MSTRPAPSAGPIRAEHVTGWVRFAGSMLAVAGVFQLIHGYTAIERSRYFSHHIVYQNLTFWGWVFIIAGVLQLIAGTMAITGRMAGNYLGVLLAMCAAVLWFFMVFAAPWAAVIGVALNLLVIHGLTVGAAGQWE